ncbi:hypothetical protein CDQ84_17605 [Clostridium thermosuccinogenes]|mgnify:CR=1 FL=1|jgi:IS30 family transposase|uniref:Transposase IS30-like HTH domain-containing protein n=1 Tax=Clostridium thermosuccinogenes TaxID=84032 RepID=A0A2K2F8M4_9CLOT|nr:helix-turn-helix domain-containing protein [Pseudoclostridium thermosuccinogenes]AUS96087.1 hypothetical protein CDO33_06335 [Pseudoclostridium thermosuccinogenes]PNT94632.1 hypothetical protein CDQ85_17585 [Pseudoclostridium thermosuccinogenes]PNT95149.1 hypothetical protein CDQ84_17605 [Pseudoclostridium thermosuccinogenes]
MHGFKHLTQKERNIIEQRLISRKSFKSIARELGNDPTTISKEVKNHIQFRETGCYGRVFNNCMLMSIDSFAKLQRQNQHILR